MDIYEQLIDDHGKQKGLLAGLVSTEGDSSERRRLFDLLKVELEAHAAAEEQVFYAELMAEPDGQEKARHSVAEHQTASNFMNRGLSKTQNLCSVVVRNTKLQLGISRMLLISACFPLLLR